MAPNRKKSKEQILDEAKGFADELNSLSPKINVLVKQAERIQRYLNVMEEMKELELDNLLYNGDVIIRKKFAFELLDLMPSVEKCFNTLIEIANSKEDLKTDAYNRAPSIFRTGEVKKNTVVRFISDR